MRKSALSLASVVLIIGLFSFVRCGKETPAEINPEFGRYISAFTSGVISAASPIRIHIAEGNELKVSPSQSPDPSWIKIKPGVSGKLEWEGERELVFIPEGDLTRNEDYQVELNLAAITEVESGFEQFQFGFKVMPQNFFVETADLRYYRSTDLSRLFLNGKLHTNDVAHAGQVEAALEVQQNGKLLPIVWVHDESRRSHSFIIDSIRREASAGSVELRWNGKPLDASDNDGSFLREIPALGDFKVLDARLLYQPEQHVEIQFSDPLDPQQDLRGLITIDGNSNLRWVIDENIVRVYPFSSQTGDRKIVIDQGVKNAMGYKLNNSATFEILFQDLKPEVRLIHGNGTILPSTGGAVLPFEAVSLAAVDVKVIRVFENNIPQFFQNNDIDGKRELKRVGRIVAQKRIALDPDRKLNLGTWNRFDLDLSEIIQAEPGAIYRVEFGFRHEYSVYPCGGAINTSLEIQSFEDENWDSAANEENSYWDFYDEYYYDDYYDYYYWDDYNYNERDNPCDKSYYIHRQGVATNILASDIGIIAKYGNDGELLCVVSDLKSTQPLQDVRIDVLDLQQQSLAKGSTDKDGMVRFAPMDHSPFLVVASQGAQKGYLRLDQGGSLSLSKFDVSGSYVKEGLKGFIYGERGVWRPGDTLFLSFMLEDKMNQVPEGNPILFELMNPRGQVMEKRTTRQNNSGLHTFIVPTSDAAPTGTWIAKVRAGGATFEQPLKIEAIKPNRLKIDISFGSEFISASDDNLEGKLKLSWLHGATAAGLRVEVKNVFSPSKTSFPTHKDFSFDDPTRAFYAEEQTLIDGYTDVNGALSFEAPMLGEGNAPGMLKANFSTKAFEAGGEFSVDRFSILYSPYSHYVGLRLPKGDASRNMLLTDTSHEIKVVSLDENGKPAGNRNLRYEFFKTEWRWWWEQGEGDLSTYSGANGLTPLAQGDFSTNAKGEGSFKIRVDYPEWGRYLVRVIDEESGHAAGSTVYIDWPGWAGRAQRENPGGASMLIFSAEKENYNVGETCRVNFPSSGSGRALVSIEDGSSVLRAFWVNAAKEQTSFEFPITPDMAPNVYVNITLIQPHLHTENDLPIRLYGLIPIRVEDPGSHLQPVITMKDVLKPEQSFEVKVSEKTGQGMSYTLAVVDEGLLNLTRFKTPDPWNFFYSKEALGVNSWDLYDDVIGAWASGIHPLLAIGGDGSAIDTKGLNKANRFKPVVMFLGPFELPAGQTKTHKLNMPNYVGSVRAMVVASHHSRAYGNAEKSVPVKQALMVLPTLPRTLSPGSTVSMPVTVFAMEEKVKDVKIELKVSGPISITGSATQQVSFAKTGDKVVDFELKVNDNIGVAYAEVIVTSGSERASQKIEIMVDNPNPKQTDVIAAVVEKGSSTSQEFDLLGIEGTNEVVLELSELPSVDFGRRLRYLLSYPHGCLEQTTSTAFPQLFLSEVTDLTREEEQRAKDHVKFAVNKITSLQSTGGGLAYWPGTGDISEWGTTYAGHFLLEAERKGYPVASGFKQQWINYQQSAARNWRRDTNGGDWRDLSQAYRLYTLALAGQPELGAMNRLKEMPGLKNTTVFTLAAAYALAGQKAIAAKMIERQTMEVAAYSELGNSFGSDLRDQAMIAEALMAMGQNEKAAELIREISKKMSAQSWYSTQSTAFGLIAYSRFAAGNKGKQITASYVLNGEKKEFKSSKPVSTISLSKAKLKGNKLEIKNTGQSLLYARIVMSGIPAPGNESPAANGLTISIVYQTLQGKIIDPSAIEQGSDFMAEVKVSNRYGQEVPNIALTQVFPSGWEILNSRMDETLSIYRGDEAEYVDVRDDRVHTYFSLKSGQTATFKVLLNASYKGKYYLPAVLCEAMYDAGIFARTAGRWVEVKPRAEALSQR